MPVSRPPISGPHGASLATTAGITAVITGVLTVSLLAQPATPISCGAIAALMAAAGLLYAARNAIGLALDHAADPALASYWGDRGMRTYHVGMGALSLALSAAAVWKLGMPGGAVAGAIGVAMASHALSNSLRTQKYPPP